MDHTKVGKFIIIEGTDGAGKTTQLTLLKDWLEKKGYKTKTLDFPQYNQFWGSMVGRFLNGDFGELNNINPYLASLPYLLDQSTQSIYIKKWIQEGYIVLSNRYVTSSMGHQTAKFLTKKDIKLNTEANHYLEWLEKAAYEEIGLVREDMTIVLYVDPEVTIKLSRKAMLRKSYAKARDIAEEDKLHQILSARTFQYLSKRFTNWKLINCMIKNQIDSIPNIHKKVLEVVNSIL